MTDAVSLLKSVTDAVSLLKSVAEETMLALLPIDEERATVFETSGLPVIRGDSEGVVDTESDAESVSTLAVGETLKGGDSVSERETVGVALGK